MASKLFKTEFYPLIYFICIRGKKEVIASTFYQRIVIADKTKKILISRTMLVAKNSKISVFGAVCVCMIAVVEHTFRCKNKKR